MKRKRGLRRVSPRAIAFADELALMRPLVEARANHLCEVCRVNPIDALHHRLRRGQGGKNTLENLLGVCWFDHDQIHANPAQSYENGRLLKRPT